MGEIELTVSLGDMTQSSIHSISYFLDSLTVTDFIGEAVARFGYCNQSENRFRARIVGANKWLSKTGILSDQGVDHGSNIEILFSGELRKLDSSPTTPRIGSGEWDVDVNRFTIDFKQKFPGSGFARVYAARETEEGRLVAIKVLKPIKDVKYYEREVRIMKTVNHPAVMPCIGVIQAGCAITDAEQSRAYSLDGCKEVKTTQSPAIVMPLMQNGSIEQIIDQPGELLWTLTRRFVCLLGIAHGMQFLHANNIYHRDLKPENVLFDDNFRPVICDFGFARLASEEENKTASIGTPGYTAPEVLRGGEYNQTVDVYSFGMTIYAIMTGKHPWAGRNKMEIKGILEKGGKPVMDDAMRRSSPRLVDLMDRCISHNRNERPSFQDIAQELRQISLERSLNISAREVSNYFDELPTFETMPPDDTVVPEPDRLVDTKPDDAVQEHDESPVEVERPGLSSLIDALSGGDALVAIEIGRRYEQGEGVERDLSKACSYYRKAAEAKIKDGYVELSRCYRQGIGVPTDKIAAKCILAAGETMVTCVSSTDDPRENDGNLSSSKGDRAALFV